MERVNRPCCRWVQNNEQPTRVLRSLYKQKNSRRATLPPDQFQDLSRSFRLKPTGWKSNQIPEEKTLQTTAGDEYAIYPSSAGPMATSLRV